MELDVEFKFSAAHHLPRYDGPCARPHGHNYRFVVTVRGEPDETSGMVIDFVEVESVVRRLVLDRVDHRDLNDELENPTAELIARWFYELLHGELPGLSKITLWEIDGCSVTYRGPGGP